MGVENIKIVLDEGKIPNEGYLILGGCSFNLYLSGVHINKQTNKRRNLKIESGTPTPTPTPEGRTDVKVDLVM